MDADMTPGELIVGRIKSYGFVEAGNEKWFGGDR
jgi:hypothetical protein